MTELVGLVQSYDDLRHNDIFGGPVDLALDVEDDADVAASQFLDFRYSGCIGVDHRERFVEPHRFRPLFSAAQPKRRPTEQTAGKASRSNQISILLREFDVAAHIADFARNALEQRQGMSV